jgi:dihydrofolate reductase
MRKVITGAFVSLDGVMQAPGGPQEDWENGFKFGGWVAPLADNDPTFGEEIGKLFGQPYDLLLGRRTYDIFASHWPYAEGGPDDAVAKSFNEITKYVVTRKGELMFPWKGTVVLRDAAKDVAKLKQEDGPALVTQGSSDLIQTLLAEDLIDEIWTFTFPVLLGHGKKLFGDGVKPTAWKVTSSRVSPTGLIVAHYVRDGDVKTGDYAMDPPTPQETARREKLNREIGPKA